MSTRVGILKKNSEQQQEVANFWTTRQISEQQEEVANFWTTTNFWTTNYFWTRGKVISDQQELAF